MKVAISEKIIYCYKKEQLKGGQWRIKKINQNSYKAGDGNCFFDLFNLKEFGIGENYSSGRGGIVEGDKVKSRSFGKTGNRFAASYACE